MTEAALRARTDAPTVTPTVTRETSAVSVRRATRETRGTGGGRIGPPGSVAGHGQAEAAASGLGLAVGRGRRCVRCRVGPSRGREQTPGPGPGPACELAVRPWTRRLMSLRRPFLACEMDVVAMATQGSCEHGMRQLPRGDPRGKPHGRQLRTTHVHRSQAGKGPPVTEAPHARRPGWGAASASMPTLP